MRSIRTKLLAGFFAVVALTLVLGLVALSKLGAVQDTAEHLTNDTIPTVQSIGDANGLMNKYRKDQLRYAIALDAAARKDAGDDVAADQADVRALVDKAGRTMIFDDADRAVIGGFERAWQGYVTASGAYKTAADEGDKVAAVAALTSGAGDQAYD